MNLKNTPFYNQPLATILFEHDMTYSDLARLMDVAPNSVRNFLIGKHTPSFNFMLRLYITLQLTSHEMVAIFFDINGSLPHLKLYTDTLRKKEKAAVQKEKKVSYGC